MKILLAPTIELAKTITADITIEAEYGDEVVLGTIYTTAHHGSRSGNPAPCIDPRIPLLRDDLIPPIPESVVLVSHIDLDTLGGIASARGDEIMEHVAFWRLAAWKDIHGAHKIKQCPQYTDDLRDKLNAYHAWAETNRKQHNRDTVTDVTTDVETSLNILYHILNPHREADAALIEAGREWQRKLDDLDISSLVSQHGRVLVRVSDKFTNALYHEDADVIVAFSTTHKTITLSTADLIYGFDCVDIMQAQLGPKAGGRANIAGSPRGEKMTFKNFSKVVISVISYFEHESMPEEG